MGCTLTVNEKHGDVSFRQYSNAIMSLESFKLERTLGKGGFGKVNACIFTPTQRWFAIKIMKKSTILEKKGLDMLVRTTILLLRLHS